MENKRTYYVWDELEVGARFETAPFTLTKETIDRYLAAVQDDTEIFCDDEAARAHGLSCAVAPPTIAAIFLVHSFQLVPSPPGGVHAKQYFQFVTPAKAGDVVITYAEIVDKYIKREKKYVEMVTRTVNQDGQVIVNGKITRIFAK
jgi:acyl dehydratase